MYAYTHTVVYAFTYLPTSAYTQILICTYQGPGPAGRVSDTEVLFTICLSYRVTTLRARARKGYLWRLNAKRLESAAGPLPARRVSKNIIF